MRRLVPVAAAAAIALIAAGSAVSARNARTLCVGKGPKCFPTLAAALAAAHDGDTVQLGPGIYAGGVTIDASINLVGAGAGRTIIKGGGPVLTIFRDSDPAGLNVAIDGVTITGGVNTNQPDPTVTFGGGVSIPVAQLAAPPFNGTGATVSISNSEITDNVVDSTSVIPPGFVCGPQECGFNDGGGIANGGVLTLTNTRVTNNTAGSTSSVISAASDAGSGGIDNRSPATLVLHHSVVSGNRTVVNGPIADSADSGGISSGGAIDVEDSVISDNTAQFAGSVVENSEENADAGGVLFDENDAPATFRNVQITGNRAVSTNTSSGSTPGAFGGGVVAFSSGSFDHVLLQGNSVVVNGTDSAIADGGGMEVDAPVTMTDSVVTLNSLIVNAPGGAVGFGGGIAMYGGDLTLVRTAVVANAISAHGGLTQGFPAGSYGGGISNGAPDALGVPSANLTLTDSIVSGNLLSGSQGYALQGGGVYNTGAVTQMGTSISGNKPDNCSGC